MACFQGVLFRKVSTAFGASCYNLRFLMDFLMTQKSVVLVIFGSFGKIFYAALKASFFRLCFFIFT